MPLIEEGSNRQIGQTDPSNNVPRLTVDTIRAKQSKRAEKRKRIDEDSPHGPEGIHEVDLEKVKPKRKKHASSRAQNHDQETESALTLANLRNSGEFEYNHDGEPASSHLQMETSEGYLNGNHEHDRLSDKHNGKKKKQKRKGKTTSHDWDGPEANRSALLGSAIEKDREAIHDLFNPAKTPDLHTPFATQLDLQSSTIDEIDSNDEALASLLQGYQAQLSPSRPSEAYNIQMNGRSYDGNVKTYEVEAQDKDCSEPQDDDHSETFSELFLHSSPPKADTLKKRKSKKSESNVDSIIITGNKPSNGVHDAAVNPLVAPLLGQEEPSPMQIEKCRDPNDTTILQQDQPGKLKRVSLTKRKQELSGAVSHASGNTKSHSLAERHFPEVTTDEQDNVLPSIEDMQTQFSQNLESSELPTTAELRRESVKASKPFCEGSKSRSTYRPANYNPSIAELAKKGGMFTSAESEQIYSFRDFYCEEHSMTHAQFAIERIQANAHNNAKLSEFWSEVKAVLPYRNRQSIQKFCRRQFHVFSKRGAWTEEEDQQLRDAVELKGKSWILVGEICERLPEDCRDRYRNHVYQSESRKKEVWTDAECRDLCRAVGECIHLLREDRRQRKRSGIEDNADADSQDECFIDEKLINWAVVSDRMQGSRSRIQCSYKWKAMKDNDRRRYWREAKDTIKKIAHLAKTGNIPEPRLNWRVKRAQHKVVNRLLPGDKLNILQSLLRHRARCEGDIVWKVLGKGDEWRERWETIDLKVAWEHIKGSSEPVEGELVEYIRGLLNKLTQEEGERLHERYKPDEEEVKAMKKKRAKILKQGTKKAEHTNRKLKSKEVIEVEDDIVSWSEEPTDENVLQTHHSNMTITDNSIDPALTATAITRRSRSRDFLGLGSD